MTEFSIFNQPAMAVTRETITILATAFPESLGNAVFINPPAYFTSARPAPALSCGPMTLV